MVRVIFLVLCLGLAGMGCSQEKEAYVEVRGRIVVEGNPLRSGSVSFQPDKTKGNASLHIPIGKVNGQGEYELYTANRLGAPAGYYRVLVFTDANSKLGPVHPVMPSLLTHRKYTRAETTDLFVEVKKSSPECRLDLELKR